MVYLDASRVELHYEMPLNEIIYDFFDALKSRTRGYGSLDYELIGYRPSKLVKLDILLNGDVVDALSFILFADNAYPRARKICEKLKENIPRAQFEIPVQAAIGGKIIARETIKAVRKDVRRSCYLCLQPLCLPQALPRLRGRGISGNVRHAHRHRQHRRHSPA